MTTLHSRVVEILLRIKCKKLRNNPELPNTEQFKEQNKTHGQGCPPTATRIIVRSSNDNIWRLEEFLSHGWNRPRWMGGTYLAVFMHVAFRAGEKFPEQILFGTVSEV